jgi:hypothetical protein
METNLIVLQAALQTVMKQRPTFIQVTVTELLLQDKGSLFRLDYRADGEGYHAEDVRQVFELVYAFLRGTQDKDFIESKFGAVLSLATQSTQGLCTTVDSINRSINTLKAAPSEVNGVSMCVWLHSQSEVGVYVDEMCRYLNQLQPQIAIQLLVQSFERSSMYHSYTFQRNDVACEDCDDMTVRHWVETEDLRVFLSLVMSDECSAHTVLSVRTAADSTLQFYDSELFEYIRSAFDKAGLTQFGVAVFDINISPLAVLLTTSFASGFISEAEILLDFKQAASAETLSSVIKRLFMETSCRAPALFCNTPGQAANTALSKSITESICSIITASSNQEFVSAALAMTRSQDLMDFEEVLGQYVSSQLPV